MERTYLQVNVPNIITVLIMGAVGITLLQFVAAGLRQYRSQMSGGA